MRVLYVSTEVHPALKTGGLADVNAALPQALIDSGADVRLLLPGFPKLLASAERRVTLVTLGPALGAERVTLLGGVLNGVPAYFIDAPEFYARDGSPYVDPGGRDWPDNHRRFALLGWMAARFADGTFDAWRPDIVHAHDWHGGLAPAYLAARGGARPGSVFTVHNLAYQGQFPAAALADLGLPAHFFSMQGIEFHGDVNFMKAGLHYADRITTVSPTYACEIQTAEQGFGMEGLLQSRAGAITGILNGVDRNEWNPATDSRLPACYSWDRPDGKAVCKATLREELGLSAVAAGPLVAVVSRMTAQKGLDLLLHALPRLLAVGGQLALLGSGDASLEEAFRAAADADPRRVAVRIGYDENLAHRMMAGADVIAVPSRFEPCGLTQMYGLAYGTLPLVRRVGGLADTVRDAAAGEKHTNGFVFDRADAGDLGEALERMAAVWSLPQKWMAIQKRAMREDFGWAPSARQYLDLYRELRPNA